jgi:hypothetical protein
VSANANAECDGLFASKLAPTGIVGVKRISSGIKKREAFAGFPFFVSAQTAYFAL